MAKNQFMIIFVVILCLLLAAVAYFIIAYAMKIWPFTGNREHYPGTNIPDRILNEKCPSFSPSKCIIACSQSDGTTTYQIVCTPKGDEDTCKKVVKDFGPTCKIVAFCDKCPTGNCGFDGCGNICTCSGDQWCNDGKCQSSSLNCAVGCGSVVGYPYGDGSFKCQKANIRTGYTTTDTAEECQKLFDSPSKVCPAHVGDDNTGGLWQKGHTQWVEKGKIPMDTKALQGSTWYDFVNTYHGLRNDCCYYEKNNPKCDSASECCFLHPTAPGNTTYGNLTF